MDSDFQVAEDPLVDDQTVIEAYDDIKCRTLLTSPNQSLVKTLQVSIPHAIVEGLQFL